MCKGSLDAGRSGKLLGDEYISTLAALLFDRHPHVGLHDNAQVSLGVENSAVEQKICLGFAAQRHK